MRYYAGVDPGSSSGCICLMGVETDEIIFQDIKDFNLSEICAFIKRYSPNIELAVLEKVTAMPRQGSVSTFSFGKGVGRLEALLTCYEVPHQLITPAMWQGLITNKPAKLAVRDIQDPKEVNRIRTANKKAVKMSIYNWCKSRFPKAELRSFNKDSNRADSLVMALYAKTLYVNGEMRGELPAY